MLVHGKCECFVMQMLYVCVHPIAALNTAFCMTCSLLMLDEDTRGDNIGYYDNLTNRPRTTTGLLTPYTGPAVKVREISSYCKST